MVAFPLRHGSERILEIRELDLKDTDPKIGDAASMNVLDNNEARLITKGSTGVQNSED